MVPVTIDVPEGYTLLPIFAPTPAVSRILTAFADRNGWVSLAESGMSKADAARQAHAKIVTAVVRAYEAEQAAQAARLAAEQAFDAEVTIT